MRTAQTPGRIKWIGTSREDLREMPKEAREDIGTALFEVQCGETPASAKPFRGVGSGVLEIVSDFDGDTFRAVYVVRFEDAVYVLHAFQKKSHKGSQVPRRDRELIEKRLAALVAAQKARKRAG